MDNKRSFTFEDNGILNDPGMNGEKRDDRIRSHLAAQNGTEKFKDNVVLSDDFIAGCTLAEYRW